MNEKGEIVGSFKKSKAGKLKLIKIAGEYKTVREQEYPDKDDILETVFENGKIVKVYTFNKIKENVTLQELINA
jgi:nicotinamide phosphoribosyltransferase